MQCIFLGYGSGVKGVLLWCIYKGRSARFILSRDITFDEYDMFDQRGEIDGVTGKDLGVLT